MPLSWNEIKSRAVSFSNDWKDTKREKAEAQSFLISFLNVLGIERKQVAYFEQRVKKIDNANGYIDLLWPGKLLVEMKSKDEDLDKAYVQALEYCDGLTSYELPELIMICDFLNFHIYRKDGTVTKFELSELILNLKIFEELAGYQQRIYHEEDPVNIAAAELMGRLHDQLKNVGYSGTELEEYLVRLLFILFADDTAIFNDGIFLDYIEQRTNIDGSDLAIHIDQIFQVLDTPENKRLTSLDEQLNFFPYVNGSLFSKRLPTAAFDSKMRQILLDCCKLNWGKISPAIFGSLFQSVMNSEERRNLGAHYTSEKNILKLIQPLFLDELWNDFKSAGENQGKLKELHRKISKLRFLDPACGCGNFLITAYKQLRLLELAIVEKLLKGQLVTNINQYFLIDLDQFYGIEIGEFPSQIAQVAMFLIDHQMNMIVSVKFGEYIPLIPLKKSAVIVNDNALRLDWQSIIKPIEGESAPSFDYILGNPPFLGKQYQEKSQREDMDLIFQGLKGAGVLDYVTCWYLKAAKYVNTENGDTTKIAFVSTNSICQGEQVGLLWSELYLKYKLKINFAHKTFKWSNEAKGKAAVYVIIIGFSKLDLDTKLLFEYPDIKGDPIMHLVKNISPYLFEGKDIFLNSSTKPICKVPEIYKGNQPTDGGYLLMNKEEKDEYLTKEPNGEPYIKEVVSGKEYLSGEKRFCFWLINISPAVLRDLPILLTRISNVKKVRLESTFADTVKLASTPTVFRDTKNPESYIVIPATSSENREYIPFGFFTNSTIPLNSVYIIPGAMHYHFGVIQSKMHMAWVRYTCGRLKSDFRYSKEIVYNNYPWPENPTDKQKKAVEEAAQAIIDVRAQYPDSSLADLYDPRATPPDLTKAHQLLDKAVDQCYRTQPFTSETKRIEYLFELYEKYTAGMFAEEKPKKGKKKEVDGLAS